MNDRRVHARPTETMTAPDVAALAAALRPVTQGTWSSPTRRDPERQRKQDERWLVDTAEAIIAALAAQSFTLIPNDEYNAALAYYVDEARRITSAEMMSVEPPDSGSTHNEPGHSVRITSAPEPAPQTSGYTADDPVSAQAAPVPLCDDPTHEPPAYTINLKAYEFGHGFGHGLLAPRPNDAPWRTTWRGVCGHLWDRHVEDTDDCPRCAAVRAALEGWADRWEAEALTSTDRAVSGVLRSVAAELRHEVARLAAARPDRGKP